MKPNLSQAGKQEIIDQVNRIILLKIKTLIINSLTKEDLQEFEKLVEKEDLVSLLAFARKKDPQLARKISQEMMLLGLRLKRATYD